MNDTDIDARLSALLAPPDEFPDEIFTARVRRTIIADETLRRARRRSWRRFTVELAGTGAVILAYFVLGRSDAAAAGALGFGPAAAGFALLAFWTMTALRPGVAQK